MRTSRPRSTSMAGSATTPSWPRWRTGSRGARDGAGWTRRAPMGDPPQISTPQHDGAADRLAQSAALAAGLPAAFAAAVPDPADPALAGVFMAGSRGTRLRTGGLPVPMRREIAWWIAACQASGERQVHASEWNRWAAAATDVARRGPGVCSFADLPLSEWMTAWGPGLPCRARPDGLGRQPHARRDRAACLGQAAGDPV